MKTYRYHIACEVRDCAEGLRYGFTGHTEQWSREKLAEAKSEGVDCSVCKTKHYDLKVVKSERMAYDL